MPDAKTSFAKDIPASIENELDAARAVDAVFLFKVNGEGGGVWTVNISTMQFFMQAKIRVTGNARLPTKLQSVIG